jgi:hypothetical protein
MEKITGIYYACPNCHRIVDRLIMDEDKEADIDSSYANFYQGSTLKAFIKAHKYRTYCEHCVTKK